MISGVIEKSNFTRNTSDDDDVGINYTEESNRRNVSSYSAAPNSTNITENFDHENRHAPASTFASATEYYSLPSSSPSPSAAACPHYKNPPLAAQICSCYQDVLVFPALWLSVIVGSLLWTLSYTAAERMCA